MKGNLLFGKEKGKKKKIIIIAVSLITVLVIIGGTAFFMLRKNKTVSFPFGQGGMGAGFQLSEDWIGVSGVISVGMTEETFEVENLSSAPVIEEVYVSSSQEIAEGDKVLKLTEESIAEARKELEKTLTEAELACRAGVIEYEQNKITAQYDYQSSLLAGEQASEVYQETIEGLTDSVTKAEEELADAKEQIEEYSSYVNDNSYRSYFKVDEYQALYDENLQVLKDKMEEWGVSWEQVTGSGGTPGGGGAYSYASILSSLYQVLVQNEKDLEQAQSDYEDAVANAAFELQTLQLSLPSLEQAVTEAKENYEVQAGQAKLTYEQTLATAERAESDYETALEKAESDYEDARDNLELFENSVGDGYFYASGSGTILRVMAQAEQELTEDSVLFLYSNPEEMSVTVSVDQTDIAKLTVGEEAYVMTSGGSGYSGSIAAIYPVTSSDSRTNVTYSVKVVLEGDTSELTENQSVTVIFGASAEDIEAMQSTGKGGNAPGQMPERTDGNTPGQMPEGTDGNAPGQMPEGTNGNAPGQMPEGTDGNTPGQSPEGTDGNTPGQPPERTDGNAPGQSPEGTDGNTPGQMPEGTDGSTSDNGNGQKGEAAAQ